MKKAIKATGFTPLNVMKLLQFEVFFGIVWNVLWSNLFYSYGSQSEQQQQSSQFLQIWLNTLIISGFVQALAYLLLINGFVGVASSESPSKDSAVPFLTIMLGIIDTLSIAVNVVLISIAAGIYMFTDLISNNSNGDSNLSQLIKAYLGSVFGMIAIFIMCATLYILSGAFIKNANSKQGNQQKYNLDYQNEHGREVEQNSEKQHMYAAVPQGDQDEEEELDNPAIKK